MDIICKDYYFTKRWICADNFSLYKLQISKSNDILRERQNQLEILAFELIKFNVKTRYANAVNEVSSAFRRYRCVELNQSAFLKATI